MPLPEWDALVGRVAPFADRTGDTPILAVAHLYEAGNRLSAEATDRYRVASAVAPGSVAVPRGSSALLSVESIADLARITRAPVRLREYLTISLAPKKGNQLEVSVEALPGLGDVVMTLQLVDGAFPPVGRILHRALTDTSPAEESAFNPDFLATYRKVARREEPVRITPHGERAAAIRIGNDFVGALIPMRRASDDPQTKDAAWSHLSPDSADTRAA
jgi:hypothetical protein